MKIVVNRCWGGFSISRAAADHMAKAGCPRAAKELAETQSKKNGRWYGYGYVEGMDGGYVRTDGFLVSAVEELGDGANGGLAELQVVEIPDDVEWEIDDYDGHESVHEVHRRW